MILRTLQKVTQAYEKKFAKNFFIKRESKFYKCSKQCYMFNFFKKISNHHNIFGN